MSRNDDEEERFGAELRRQAFRRKSGFGLASREQVVALCRRAADEIEAGGPLSPAFTALVIEVDAWRRAAEKMLSQRSDDKSPGA